MAIHNPQREKDAQEDADLQSKKPPLYAVFLLNDDYTTMDFVIHVLETIFHMPVVEATRIMLHVHKSGRGLAGIYTREIAETKLDTVHKIAREHEFPLKCVMEKE
ncbi:MAG: ATP-dependent Clp protease adapter ClpS [Nitrospirae bacterium]|nr:ATP-dependent Clp protease adapter ClpS [Nitrospirota bacterium]